MKYGFLRVAAATPSLKVADCEYNASEIVRLIEGASDAGVEIIVFPELSITAYTCGDLFHQKLLLDSALQSLQSIMDRTRCFKTASIIGLPLSWRGSLYNCAAVIQGGSLWGIVPKMYIPGYKEYYEERWFSPGFVLSGQGHYAEISGQKIPFGPDMIFMEEGRPETSFGIEICEDLWVPVPPSCFLSMNGARIIFNPSASNETVGKSDYRKELVAQQSGRCISGYVYACSGIDESTTDLVFSGHSLIAENGAILKESDKYRREGGFIFNDIDVDRLENDRMKNTSFLEFHQRHFQDKSADVPAEVKTGHGPYVLNYPNPRVINCGHFTSAQSGLVRYVEALPFVPSDAGRRNERCSEIFSMQTAGLAKRFTYTGLKKAVIGISGGLDSTLALLVTVRAFDMLGYPRNDIIGITMPGFGTSDTTYKNAVSLLEAMNTNIREIDIREACAMHLKEIGHAPGNIDVTYENVQARERTQVLMDIANQEGGLVIGTGDLSEIALGWSTYNGDHMSMYAVNCSIPKSLVRYLIQWVADNVVDKTTCNLLLSILDTPITPELIPPDAEGRINQKTEEIIGPYELHDFFLYHMARYGAPPAKILFLANEVFKGKYEKSELLKWLKVFYKRFFTQQFKRSCMPDGPKVGTVSLSPRGDWRMPSDAEYKCWLDDLNESI